MVVARTYLDQQRSVEERVEALLSQMTLEEKVAQLWGVWVTDVINDARQLDSSKAQKHLANGAGHLTRVGALSLVPPTQNAALANSIQRYLVENTRLGIPAILHEESCAGYLARGATTFPQAIGMAATWQPELIEKMADIIRQQMRAVGGHHTLAPVLDVVRDARWGRVEETFGEDPFLISALGTAYTKGIQGDNWLSGVIATAKHFIGYGASEGGMNWAPAHIPERELREIYVPPFAAAIKEGRIASAMNAYHEMDGIPCANSYDLMVKLLREELGFDGVVVSDYFAINMLMEYHHVAPDKKTAAITSLQAGIDVELPAADCYGQPLIDALKAGEVDISLIETSVRRLLKQKFELGLFEHPYVDEGRVIEFYDQPHHQQLSYEIALKSMVLLKNDGLLPLNPAHKKVAVIGPHADSVRLMQGDYHYPSHLENIFDPNKSMDAPNPSATIAPFDWTDHFPPSVTVLKGIEASDVADVEVVYAQGCGPTGDNAQGIAQAVATAETADVIVLTLGDQSGLGGQSTVGESIDSATLELPAIQQQLLQALYATGKPIVAVLFTGRPYNITWLDEHLPAILQAWLPGEQGGAAIADVLFGKVNPGGKLPMSFPRHVGQLPMYYNHKPSGARSHWQGEYHDMPTTPLYPFGHGLSYTSFTYSDLTISNDKPQANDTIDISVTVANTGAVAGDEIVQLYVHDLVGSVARPVQELKGFTRVTLNAGESCHVTFHLSLQHLGFYDRQMQFVVEPGDVEIMVGSSSKDIRQKANIVVGGATTPVEPAYFTPVTVA